LEILAAFIQSLLQTKSAFFITNNFLLPLVLIVLNTLWIYLFAISLRNYYRTPSIDRNRQAKSSTCSNSNQISIKDRCNDTELPFVSIIVPARNEQNHIARCLTSLLSQDYPNFEIIAVNDNSTDNTLKIMHEIQKGYLYESTGSRSQQRQKLEFTHGNSNVFSINSNTLTSVNGDRTRRRTDDATVTVSLGKKDFMPITDNNNKNSREKLKIISLKDKPKGWTGKSWASQQGYLCSKGDILIFTDADTCYINNDTILSSISYFKKENLDVLTGFPFVELRDFWSKMVNPVWNLIGTLFGYGAFDINNPESEAASLMGCFITIKRKVFEDMGTYKVIRSNIREDEALGIRTKEVGYKIGGVQMDKSLTALWSSDLLTLWHGIARTILPALLNKNGKKKRKVIRDLLVMFLMTVLPFILLPYNFGIVRSPNSTLYNYSVDNSNFILDQSSKLLDQIHFIILLLNLSACIGLFVGSSAKAVWGFKISPVYAIISPFGATFLDSSCTLDRTRCKQQ
jgi:cellulose synthase/poly-beta-1,6-N-acetylglucosamine synthase-like glycosyltransferase